MTARYRYKFFTVSVALVLTLPYAAPSTCGLLGRMGAAMEMTADEGDSALEMPGSTGMCCAFNECGVSYVAPLTGGLDDLPLEPAVRMVSAALPSTHPTNAVLPLTPPPQA